MPQMMRHVASLASLVSALRHGMPSLAIRCISSRSVAHPCAQPLLRPPRYHLAAMKQPKLASFFQPKPPTAATLATAKDADVLREAPAAVAADAALEDTDAGGDTAAATTKRRRMVIADDDDEDVQAHDSGEEAAAPVPHAKTPSPRRKAPKPAAKPAAAKPTAKVEGVGALTMAAAAAHADFDLGKLASWSAGAPVPFAFLADTFEAVAEESKRLAIISIMVDTFRTVMLTTPEDLLPMVYLCTNRVAAPHDGLELGVGDSILLKALAESTGRDAAVLKREYDAEGDLGKVAASSRASQRLMFQPKALTIREVFKIFRDIATAEGKASQDRKKALIQKLLRSAQGIESGFIIRALQGKLRIGLAEQSVLVALAHAAVLAKNAADDRREAELAGILEEAAQLVKQAYSECPSFDDLVPALLQHPIADLPQYVHFRPGVPVRPMLAKPTVGVGEVLDKFSGQEFTCEYKYDGERAQVHVLEDGSVRIYSRNAENNTTKYPDIAALVTEVVGPTTTSIVFDAEAVAYDRETDKILPFQVLSTRARKDVKVEDIKVQVCLYAFDCLYLNGTALLREPLTKRREALYGAIREVPGRMRFASFKTSKDVEELAAFLDESVAAGTEGLIVKTMDATYEPSKRSLNWLKLKKDYLEGVGDTFDVVPIGAEFGRGKRTGVYGAYLLAVYDAESEEYQTISKCGTGFSEQQLIDLKATLEPHVIKEPKSYYRVGDAKPDVWFDTAVVWEVKAADLSISPAYQAAKGLVDSNNGISIRFPRFIRVRDDKGPEDATSAEQVAEMYQKQALAANNTRRAAEDDDL